MKILTGYLKNKNIKVPKTIRPCTSIIKQAIFNIIKDQVEDAIFLDLFAGSGSLGIEAISLGAKLTFFVDKSKESINYIKTNITLLEIENKSKVIIADALEFLKKTNLKFDIITIDPPFILYEKDPKLIDEILKTIAKRDLLNKDGNIFLEEPTYSKREKQVDSLILKNVRKYGSAFLLQYIY
jgi:16S rRNA (guanine(966)-N(2))-methyltransferase RsmD